MDEEERFTYCANPKPRRCHDFHIRLLVRLAGSLILLWRVTVFSFWVFLVGLVCSWFGCWVSGGFSLSCVPRCKLNNCDTRCRVDIGSLGPCVLPWLGRPLLRVCRDPVAMDIAAWAYAEGNIVC